MAVVVTAGSNAGLQFVGSFLIFFPFLIARLIIKPYYFIQIHVYFNFLLNVALKDISADEFGS
jgi:hypothetical protein